MDALAEGSMEGGDPPQALVVHELDYLGWGVTNRDSVTISTKRVLPDGSILLASDAVDHAAFPVQASPVRLRKFVATRISPWVSEDGDTTGVEFTSVSLTDPGGSIPKWLVESLASQSVDYFVDMEAEVADNPPR